MKLCAITSFGWNRPDPTVTGGPSRAIGFGARISSIGLMVCLLFVATALPGMASPELARSRSFNGITATFEIKNPIIKLGEDLKIVVVYRNTSSRTVHFRFFHLDEDADLYRKGKRKPIIGGFVGEPQALRVTLSPGESFRFEDIFNMKKWPDLPPGDYEIHFSYHLGLLSDESLVKKYQAKYPHDGYVVPWG